jgi:hypothetical protein
MDPAAPGRQRPIWVEAQARQARFSQRVRRTLASLHPRSLEFQGGTDPRLLAAGPLYVNT